jgi:hypothetical protein
MTAPETASASLELVLHPLTGEAIALEGKATDEVVALYSEGAELLEAVKVYRDAIRVELVARLDRGGERSATIGRYRLETNAPTSEEYRADVLEEELRKLTELEDAPIEERVVENAVPWAKPPKFTPARKVDKRVVNKLKNSDDRRVLAAIAKARTVVTNTRTLKVEEVDAG